MLLAVDSSTQWMGLALYDGSITLSQMTWRSHHTHTIDLTSAIEQILARNNVKAADLSAIGVALGPGSYTSLRVGLAVVKGIALGRKIPVLGVPTLDYLVYPISADRRPVIGILTAGRGRYTFSKYRYQRERWVSQEEPALATVSEIAAMIQEETIVCGEISDEIRTYFKQFCPSAFILSPARCSRYPAFLAEIAWQRYKLGQKDDAATLAPIYPRTEKVL